MCVTTANVKQLSKVDQIEIQEIYIYEIKRISLKIVLRSLLHENQVMDLKLPIIHTKAKRRWKGGRELRVGEQIQAVGKY